MPQHLSARTTASVPWTSVLALLLLAAIAGCGGGNASNPAGSEGDGATAGKAKKIGVSLLTLENPFFKVIGDNITTEGAKHGYETVVVSADKDVAKQGNQIKDFIVQRVDAIVLSPCDSKAIVPIIQEANDAGIPVFTVDIPCREQGVKIVSQIATDNFGGGQEAAKAIVEALGEAGGQVAIIHFKQAESCILRVEGFRDVIDKHNASVGEAGKIEIVTELEGGGAKDLGYKAAEDALQAHPNLDAIFAINDPSALGARGAVEKAQKEDSVLIVGFDGQPEGKQAIKEGKIYADPIQFPDRMGVEVVSAIVKHSAGEEVEPEILIPTRLYTKQDAESDPELK